MKTTKWICLIYCLMAALLLSGCACSHEFGEWKATTAATCTTDGVEQRSCTKCEESEERAVPALTHAFGNWTVKTAATCTSDGVEQKVCTMCNASEERPIPKIAHSYDSGTVTQAATCTTDGTKTVACTACGHTKTETIKKLAHTYDAGTVTKEATCTTDGNKTVTCTACGHAKTETIKKLAHDYGDDLICSYCKAVASLDAIMTSSEKKDAAKVYWRSGISVNHDERKKEFTISFTFQDKDKTTYLKVPSVVEITIINDDNETVYSANKILRVSDYNGSQAVVIIKDSEIKGSKNTYGEISIKVYNDGYFSYDATTSRIYGELPLEAIKIQLPTLPQTIHEYDSKKNIESSVKITNITYELYSEDSVKFFVTGEKLYDEEGTGHSSSTLVGWKLYDAEGYIIDSDTFYSPGIKMGEKFRDEEFISWDKVVPGGSYRLEILNVR